MNRYLRLLSLVLSLLLLFPWTLDAAATELITDGPIDAEDNAILIGQLESTAVDYVTKYVNTAYLYETEDFTTNTLLAVSDEDLSRVGITQLTTDGTAASTADLKANLQQFADVAGYYKHIRSEQNQVRNNLKISISDIQTTIQGDCAQVKLYTTVSFQYPQLSEPTYCGCHYIIYFSKINHAWIISDIYSEELYYYGMDNPSSFDCQKAIQEFDVAFTKETSIAETEAMTEVTSDTSSPYSLTSTNNIFYSYNRSHAIAYANTYAMHYNSNFANYGSDGLDLGGNCQNFASQCIWAGLYGNNSTSAISGKNYPMDTVGTINDDYWYDGGNAYDPGHNWISCRKFRYYAENFVIM